MSNFQKVYIDIDWYDKTIEGVHSTKQPYSIEYCIDCFLYRITFDKTGHITNEVWKLWSCPIETGLDLYDCNKNEFSLTLWAHNEEEANNLAQEEISKLVKNGELDKLLKEKTKQTKQEKENIIQDLQKRIESLKEELLKYENQTGRTPRYT